jgi:exodeoxyribonuclease V alpha subunit
VELCENYRFGKESGIGAASSAVRDGEEGWALAILQQGGYADIGWHDLPPPEVLPAALRDLVVERFGPFLTALTFQEMMTAFESFRILCALRQGPFGVVALNSLVESILVRERLIAPVAWYRGRPIMITQNDYNLQLFNGDVGIILPHDWGNDQAGKNVPSASEAIQDREPEFGMRAFFLSASGTVRKLSPARLPAFETVYAMTVHKSQGSEFGEVLLLLPDRDSPVLTRELLYTGITRARRKAVIWGREPIFRAAAARRIHRHSGLRDALWAD